MTAAKLDQAGLDQASEPTWEVALLFPAQGAWSEEEYLALETNHLVEFSHGTIEVLPMPSDRHQALVGFLYVLFLTFARKSGGLVRLVPLRVRLWAGKVREPDLLYLASARDPRRQADYWTGADLVVEVVSPDDPQRDLVTKRNEYAQAHIQEYWIVQPQRETVTVLQLAEGLYRLHGEFKRGQIATSANYAGLAVNVAELFDAD
jgi:Uma2 family endonuclease